VSTPPAGVGLAGGGGDGGRLVPGQQVLAGGVADPQPLQGADLACRGGTPSTCSASRLKPVPTVRLRSLTVIPPALACQPKSRRPRSPGPSSRRSGPGGGRGAAGAEGVVRVSRPATKALPTTARTSRATPAAPASGKQRPQPPGGPLGRARLGLARAGPLGTPQQLPGRRPGRPAPGLAARTSVAAWTPCLAASHRNAPASTRHGAGAPGTPPHRPRLRLNNEVA
jgi:hypothetical protein